MRTNSLLVLLTVNTDVPARDLADVRSRFKVQGCSGGRRLGGLRYGGECRSETSSGYGFERRGQRRIDYRKERKGLGFSDGSILDLQKKKREAEACNYQGERVKKGPSFGLIMGLTLLFGLSSESILVTKACQFGLDNSNFD